MSLDEIEALNARERQAMADRLDIELHRPLTPYVWERKPDAHVESARLKAAREALELIAADDADEEAIEGGVPIFVPTDSPILQRRAAS